MTAHDKHCKRLARRTCPLAVLVCVFMAMSGCQTNVKDEATVHATWKYSLVSIPK